MPYSLGIALIVSQENDGLASTVVDGLLTLKNQSEDLKIALSKKCTKVPEADFFVVDRKRFIAFARQADLILFFSGKQGTDYRLAEDINQWQKTIFIDGSEVGKNRRFDAEVQYKVLQGTYKGYGSIDYEMLRKCLLYFRREKPYINGILPLPMGIESSYVHALKNEPAKDIDFCCVFGQDQWPLLRRYARELLVDFCRHNAFSCWVDKTRTREEFYKILARSKVGISIGGGGYDTMRFWEILGNNCLLLTECIDIYELGSQRLSYGRIWEFGNLYDFQVQLNNIGQYLRSSYSQEALKDEYQQILNDHSSASRAREIINSFLQKSKITTSGSIINSCY